MAIQVYNTLTRKKEPFVPGSGARFHIRLRHHPL